MVGTAIQARYRWEFAEPAKQDSLALAEACSLHPVMARLLAGRQITDIEQARHYLSPTLHDLPDPLAIPGMEAAIETLADARDAGTTVLIHGDYDVDGISGSALLARLLDRVGIAYRVFLPNRYTDGYSFGPSSYAAVKEAGAGLVLAVDNGTTAHEALARFRELGVEVVVVDHHPPDPDLPPCAALVNPWLAPPTENLPPLCGAGVAYLLAWGLLRHLASTAEVEKPDRDFLIEMLGLAALATVADIVPLIGANRAIVHYGLIRIQHDGLLGLQELAKIAGVRSALTAEDVGFKLGPRLNAAGRLRCARPAFDLLMTKRPSNARELAAQLDAMNRERRTKQDAAERALEAQVEEALARGDRALFLGAPDLLFGLLGVVAGRIRERTGLPTFLWGEASDGVCRGSARAPSDQSLLPLLDGARDLFTAAGGHAAAAGFSFPTERADAIAERMRAVASALPKPVREALRIDAEVEIGELDADLMRQLGRMEPCGKGNPAPTLAAHRVHVLEAKPLGKDGSHLALRLEQGAHSIRAIAWGGMRSWGALAAGNTLDVLFRPTLNRFAGRTSIEMHLLDLRTAASHTRC